jgi:glycosyltransferase involved in cell wall biosynthesis
MNSDLPAVLLAGTFFSERGGSRAPIEDLAQELRQAGYRTICVSRFRSRPLRVADLLSRALLSRSKYDIAVVDLYSGAAFLWGEALSFVFRMLGRPFVISLHGGGLPEFAAGRPRRVAACLGRAAGVTAPSGYLRDRLRPYCGRIRLIPNPLHLKSYPYRLRARVRPEIVWVRGFHAMYNPELAVRVVARLAPEFPDIHLVMVVGVAGRIDFTGPIPHAEVAQRMSSADIFINTSNIDNTPLSVLEAMACGLCVVTTDAGGIPYLVEDGCDAISVPRDDPERMAAALRSILTDEALAQRLSGRARRKAAAFDWPAVLPVWEELLSRAAGRPYAARAAAAD